jgi:hypothetical protein
MATSHAEIHHQVVDVTNPGRHPRVLMVVANPGISTTLRSPVGFWAAELFHPYYEFSQKRDEDVSQVPALAGDPVADRTRLAGCRVIAGLVLVAGEPCSRRELERPTVTERLVLGQHRRHELVRALGGLRRVSEIRDV